MKNIFHKVFLLSCISYSAYAHTAMMNCVDNGEGNITCEGAFSDGSSAQGVSFVLVQKGKIIFQTKFDENSEVTFQKPLGKYSLIFDAGEMHTIVLQSKNIVE